MKMRAIHKSYKVSFIIVSNLCDKYISFPTEICGKVIGMKLCVLLREG